MLESKYHMEFKLRKFVKTKGRGLKGKRFNGGKREKIIELRKKLNFQEASRDHD